MFRKGIIFALVGILFLGTFTTTVSANSNENSNENSEKASDFAPGRYIVVLKEGFSPSNIARDHGMVPEFVYSHALNGFAGNLPTPILSKLQEDSRVKYIEQEKIYYITAQNFPTGLDRIDAELNPTANINNIDERVDATIAIIDTGIYLSHSDLNVNVAKSVDCTPGICFSGAGRGNDGHGHGTHVAGTAAALDNNIGVVGIAPGAELIAVKVLNDNGSGFNWSILAGIDYVTWTRTNNDPDDDIDVANMSLGGPNSQSIRDAVTNSIASGVVYAVAAGNDGVDAGMTSPANTLNAITVSAIADFDGQPGGLGSSTCRTDQDDTLADFSNYGFYVDIAAPGVCIQSLMPPDICLSTNGYCNENSDLDTISGTSMAAPHVAGAAALEIANDSSLTPEMIRSKLLDKAINQNAPGGFLDSDPTGASEPLLYVGENLNQNQIPTANAGADQIVTEGDNVTLDGSASTDSDGTIVLYSWIQTGGDTVLLSNPNIYNPTFTAPAVSASEIFTFDLTVTDNDGATKTASTSVTVNPSSVNPPPTAVSDLALFMASSSQVDLNWTTPSDGGSPITGYKIEKKTIGAGTLVIETSFGDATTNSYSDTTVSAGDRVTYRIFAINADGTAPPSNIPPILEVSTTSGSVPTADTGNS